MTEPAAAWRPPEAFLETVDTAFARLGSMLAAGAPTLGSHFADWQSELAGGAAPTAYYTHPDAFPLLLLPWWLDGTLHDEPDRELLDEVTYSSICGYFVVRLIDDLMDGDRAVPAGLLPAIIVLHTEFIATYLAQFRSDDPFWEVLEGTSMMSSEVAGRDAGLADIDRATFLETSARKVAGAVIPIAAVAHHAGRPDLVEPWSALVDRLGAWHQMRNDILDWRRDLERGRATFFLSEARRAVADADDPTSISAWVLDGGIEQGIGELEEAMTPLLDEAGRLGSDDLVSYLELRRSRLAADWQAMRPSLEAIRRLARALR